MFSTIKHAIRKFFSCDECGKIFGNPKTCETCRAVDEDMRTYSF